MPAPAAGSADSAIVHRIRQAAKVGHFRCSERTDDRQDVGRKDIRRLGQRSVPRGGRFCRIVSVALLAPRAFRAASATLVRSEISRRSFSANAA